MDAGANRSFLKRVTDEPGPTGAGFINLHTRLKNTEPHKNGGKDWVIGWPLKTVDDLISKAQWINGTTTFFDVWYCTSRQSEAGTNARGKPKAIRLAKNAMTLKAIWADVDVGNKPGETKHYDTADEAASALIAFMDKVELPVPSAVVNSGGGLHIYWISDVPLTPAQWRPYAQGLKALLLREGIKCDAGLTTDEARILRVPGTMNHKYTPPKPVVLNYLGKDYNFATTLSFLPHSAAVPAAGASRQSVVPVKPADVLMDPTADFSAPDAAFASLDPKQGGLGERTQGPHLVPWEPIFEQCAFYGDALLDGGKNHDNPLWNIAVLGTAFMEDGNEIAHRISKGHSGYTPVETQEKYDRKLVDRRDGGVGYPSCATIASLGCKACATCPLLARGKSPLNIRAEFTAAVNSPPTSNGPTPWSATGLTVSFSNLPHRRTLYGSDLVRAELTVLAGPGGGGKSSIGIGIGGSITTGRELLGEKIRGCDLKALIINAEDSGVEIGRRVWAFCLAHGVFEHEISRLYVVGADDPRVQRMRLLRTNQKGQSELDSVGFNELRAALMALRPDLVVLDPLVALCAGGNMNDNPSMALVMRGLKQLAAEFDCAFLIIHHTRKGADPGSAEAISGASAITNLSRRAIMPVFLDEAEAGKLGILPSERLSYVKLVDAKSNLTPRSTLFPLYRLHSVELPNPHPPTYPFGDNVQAIVRVQLPLQGGGAISTDEQKIQQAILALVPRGVVIDGQSYPYSPSPAGAENVRTILRDAVAAAETATAPRQWVPGDLEAVVKNTLKELQRDGRLLSKKMEELMKDPGRFRRARGLQVNPANSAEGGSDATNDKSAA